MSRRGWKRLALVLVALFVALVGYSEYWAYQEDHQK